MGVKNYLWGTKEGWLVWNNNGLLESSNTWNVENIITEEEHNNNKAIGIFSDKWHPEKEEFPQFPVATNYDEFQQLFSETRNRLLVNA